MIPIQLSQRLLVIDYDFEVKDNITKEKTENIVKQLDEYLRQNKNN